ncbi:uncharacterized protein LOC127009743 [Eriocheir sinensis]|uniref:uncharacterized protein LOC127009743 n=1 Tax=Eriocheir sinensis TaxID=95602 RepID=UPI0021C76A17|nr:uncharacterized protein LOC127009743 [Eriocheir sinensis]
METKVVSKMFPKAFSKHNIRRAVLGTCVVLAADGGASGGAPPRKVTITLLRRRGCWRALSSRGVAVFAFPEASGPFSVTAPLDLEYLFRCSGKPDAAATQIKICVAYCRGATRKARVSLEEFLEALLHGGRPGSFYLYIYDDKVGLQLVSQQFQALPTTWPLEQKPGKGKMAMYTDGNTDATYNEWQVYLEKVFAVEDHEANTDNDDDTYSEQNDLPERVSPVKDDDFDEAAHEDGEACDVAAAEEEEASDVPAAEEEELTDVAAAEEEEASDVPAAEEEELSDVAAAEEEQASDVPAAEEEQASDVPAAEEDLTVPQRFISCLVGPSDRQLEDLQRSQGVSIVRVRRTLHIKGDRDAVLRCHRHMRDEIAEWRRRESAEAQ